MIIQPVLVQIGFVTFEDCGVLSNVTTLGLRTCRNAGRRMKFGRFIHNFPNLEELAIGPGVELDFTSPPFRE
jgi:hypothetical protein